jgi:hypothetical protein
MSLPAPQVDVLPLPSETLGSISRELGFLARGYIVDNLTSQWIFLSEPFVFVPPYTVSTSGPLSGSQKLTASFKTPTGFSVSGVVPGQVAFIRCTQDAQPASPGVAIPPGVIVNQAFNSQLVGPNVVSIEAAAPGKQIYVASGIFGVGAVAALGSASVEETSGGRTIAQIDTTALGNTPFSASQFAVKAGQGIAFRVTGGATVSISLLYAK